MKGVRFIPTEKFGLVLETPFALTPMQRESVRLYAEKEYRRRIKSLTGERRDAMVRVLTDICMNNFIERAVPMHDCSKEISLYGEA